MSSMMMFICRSTEDSELSHCWPVLSLKNALYSAGCFFASQKKDMRCPTLSKQEAVPAKIESEE